VSAPDQLRTLRAALARAADPAGLEWIEDQILAAGGGDREAVARAFPAVGRRIGRGPLGAAEDAVRADGVRVPLAAWRVDDAGRAAMLAAFPGDVEALASELYFGGDARERAGALRALALLGRGEGARGAVQDACRANAADLFEAAVAENPYTSSVLSEREFRSALLKAVFIGLSPTRFAAIEERADAELTRMLLAYVTEREAAGRSVPPDLWLVASLAPTPELVARMLDYLEHPSRAHREAAALGLGRAGDADARRFLSDRLEREDDERVREALTMALAPERGRP
jgi:hypothetical protein